MYLHEPSRDTACQPPVTAQNLPWFHLDPRARILTALLLTCGALLTDRLELTLAFFLLAALLLVLARCKQPHTWGQVRAALWSVNLFMAFVWLTLPFTVPGTSLSFSPAWLQHMGFPLTVEGVQLAVLLTLKANTSLLFLLTFCGTLDLNAFGTALQGLGVSARLVTLFILVCRHIACLRDEYRMSLQALRLRAPGTRGMRALHLYACLTCSVLVRSADRAEMVRMALLCKPGPLLYTSALRLRWTWLDSSSCAVALSVWMCSVWGTLWSHMEGVL